MLAALLYVANHDHTRPLDTGTSLVFKHRGRGTVLYGLAVGAEALVPAKNTNPARHTAMLPSVTSLSQYELGVRGGGSAALFTIGDNLAIGCLLAIFAPNCRD